MILTTAREGGNVNNSPDFSGEDPRGRESSGQLPRGHKAGAFESRTPLAQVPAPYVWAVWAALRDRASWAQRGNWAGEGEGVGHPHSPRVVPGPAGRGRAGTLRRSPPPRCTCWRPGAAPSFPEGGGAEMCTRSASGGVAVAPRSPAHITCCSELNASRKLPLVSPFGALGLIKSGFPLSLKSQHQVTQR